MRAFLSAHWSILALWCLFASLIDFALMGLDKRKARREDWRIPERVLWAFALLVVEFLVRFLWLRRLP